MKRSYQITGIVLILFAAFLARESLELQFYTSLGPGPGFFPFWISLIMLALAAMMVFHASFGESAPMPSDFFPSKDGLLRMAFVCGALIAPVLFFDSLGFRITMLAFLLFLLTVLGRVNLIATALVGVAGSWGTFWLFDQVLRVPLPIGMFGV